MSQMPDHANLPDIVLPDEPVATVAVVVVPAATVAVVVVPAAAVAVVVVPAAAVAVVVVPAAAVADQAFDPNSTAHFQAKMRRAPVWFSSFVASNHREKHRFRDELVHIKGAWPLLMKQRKGGTWTPDDKVRLKAMVRSASSVSPYLFIWAIPGSMVLLPFLAWFLDRQRRKRAVERRRQPD